VTPTPPRRLRGHYIWLGIALSVICLLLVLRQVDLAATWQTLFLVDYTLVIIATANVVLILLVKAARWRLLFYPSQRDVDYSSLLSALIAGVFINFALPVRLGDLVRAYLAGLGGASRLHALGTVAVEKLLDMVALAIMLLLLLPDTGLPSWILQPAWGLAAVALASLVAGLVLKDKATQILGVIERHVSILARLRASEKARLVLDSLEPLSNWRVLTRMAAWTALVWMLSVLTLQLLLRAMGLHLSFMALLLVNVILLAGVAVPSSPGKLGVFHGICIWALSLVGITGTLRWASA